MHEEPSANPLIKPVQGHLFKFEETIFGMSLQQLLADLGVMTGSVALTGSLPLVVRIVVCVLITGGALVGIHGKVQGMSFGYWLSVWIRSKMVPGRMVWRADNAMKDAIQATWIPIETLQQGIAGKSERGKKGEMIRYWLAFEVEGKNIRLFPEHEQVRIFGRFESFLTGFEFHLHCLSLTEQIDPQTAAPLLMQKEALATAACPGVAAGEYRGAGAADECLYQDATFSRGVGIQCRGGFPTRIFAFGSLCDDASAHVQKGSCAVPVSGARPTAYSSGSRPKSVSASGSADLAAARS